MSSSVVRAAARASVVYRKRGLAQIVRPTRTTPQSFGRASTTTRLACLSSLAATDHDYTAQRTFYAVLSSLATDHGDTQSRASYAILAAAAAAVVAGATTTTALTTDCDAPAAEPKKAGGITRLPTIPRNVNLKKMKSLKGRNLEDKYIVDWETILGEGAYGSVHPARLKSTGEKVALKKISRRYTTTTGFKTETSALLRIYDQGGHPNISGLRDMYEDHNHFYLILDLVSGGEMFEHLINYGAYSEADAARLMYEVASALAFLHGIGVVHADLKPENLLLSTKNRLDGTIKMIDFGCAVVQADEDDVGFFGTRKKPLTKSANSTGTTAYWAPERFKKGRICDASMDMWSLGVILYIMLTGCHPYDLKGTSTDDEIEERIRNDPTPPFDEEIVGHLSKSAIDLIKRLMEKDPKKRMTAYEMLQHPWVRGETASTEKMQDSDKKLSRFKDTRDKLEASMFAVLVSQSYGDARISEAKVKESKKEGDAAIHVLQRAFAVFDAEGKGFVTPDDLGRVASDKTGSVLSSRDTKEFLETTNGSGEQPLSLSRFNKLFSGLHQRHYPRGHYIFHAGEAGDAMYFINSGKVEIQTRKGQLVAILRSGDFFGEGSLLDKSATRFTTAKCSTPVDVIEIKRADFDRYLGVSKSVRSDLTLKWRARTLKYAKNLLRLQKNVALKTYKNGEVIYKEGDFGNAMYRVDDVDGGELTVSHAGRVVHKYTAGDSFGESSLLFNRPRSSTVTCSSDVCRLHKMKGDDFIQLVESSPEMKSSLLNMCRKRIFKKAVKQYSLANNRGYSDDDIVAAFHGADIDRTGFLNIEEVRLLMHKMDPEYPLEEIKALLDYVDIDGDGKISLEEFKQLFRQFEEEKEAVAEEEAIYGNDV